MQEFEKGKILVVDDMDTNRFILREILHKHYDVTEAVDGYEALSLMIHGDLPDLVLLDIMMPELDGLEVFRIMRNNLDTANIPVIFITASGNAENEIESLRMGATDYITKPFIPEAVLLRVNNCMELASYWKNLEREMERKVERLAETTVGMLEIMAEMLEYRDSGSGQHVKRTQNLMGRLIREMMNTPRFSEELNGIDCNAVISAAPLHDIGKIAMPDNILLKPGKLTAEEYELIKRHTIIGGELMDKIRGTCDEAYYINGRNICLYHHERWDGTGYPHGLKGTDIPLPARVMSVIDVYDALISERPYKQPFSHDEAVRIIIEGIGTQFDPDIAMLFCSMDLEESV